MCVDKILQRFSPPCHTFAWRGFFVFFSHGSWPFLFVEYAFIILYFLGRKQIFDTVRFSKLEAFGLSFDKLFSTLVFHVGTYCWYRNIVLFLLMTSLVILQVSFRCFSNLIIENARFLAVLSLKQAVAFFFILFFKASWKRLALVMRLCGFIVYCQKWDYDMLGR